MKTTLWLIFYSSLIVLLGMTAYCGLINRSAHLSVDPFRAVAFFGPVFVLGLIGRRLTKGCWLSARFVEVVGFVGTLFVFYVTDLNILNQYEKWIANGMPDRNPHGDVLLIGFVLGGLGGSLLIGYLATRIATRKATQPQGHGMQLLD